MSKRVNLPRNEKCKRINHSDLETSQFLGLHWVRIHAIRIGAQATPKKKTRLYFHKNKEKRLTVCWSIMSTKKGAASSDMHL